MKKMILLFAVVFISLSGFSQFTPKFIFCNIVGQGTLGGNVKITVDYGDIESTRHGDKLTGKDGKPMKFGSMTAALNYMGIHGWEFVQAYAVSYGNGSVYNFLMKKPYTEFPPEIQALYKWND